MVKKHFERFRLSLKFCSKEYFATSRIQFRSAPAQNDFPFTSQDHDPDIIHAVNRLEAFNQFTDHDFIKSIMNFRSVQPDDCQVSLFFEFDGLIIIVIRSFETSIRSLIYILNTPYFVSGNVQFSEAAIPIAIYFRVSTGSMMPSSQSREVLK